MGGCWSCPHQETVAIIESFGKFQRIGYPGCNCLNPLCCESVAGVLSLRVQQLDVTCESKTLDNVFVVLVVSVQYHVRHEQIFDAYYKLTNSKAQISSYVFDVVRGSVPKMKLDDVFVNKETIARSIKEELTKSMEGFGFVILQALVNDIAPAVKVKEAMNDINAATRLRVAALEKAEAAKVTVVKSAEADAEAQYLQGAGVARQRQAIIAGLQQSVKEFSGSVENVTPRDVMELLLITQYYDMLRDVGGNAKSTAVFTASSSAEPGGGDWLAQSMRRAMLEARAGQEMVRD